MKGWIGELDNYVLPLLYVFDIDGDEFSNSLTSSLIKKQCDVDTKLYYDDFEILTSSMYNFIVAKDKFHNNTKRLIFKDLIQINGRISIIYAFSEVCSKKKVLQVVEKVWNSFIYTLGLEDIKRNYIITHHLCFQGYQNQDEFDLNVQTIKEYFKQNDIKLPIQFYYSDIKVNKLKGMNNVIVGKILQKMFPITVYITQALNEYSGLFLERSVSLSLWDFSTSVVVGNNTSLYTNKSLICTAELLDQMFDTFTLLRKGLQKQKDFKLDKTFGASIAHKNGIFIHVQPILLDNLVLCCGMPNSDKKRIGNIKIRMTHAAKAVKQCIIDYLSKKDK